MRSAARLRQSFQTMPHRDNNLLRILIKLYRCSASYSGAKPMVCTLIQSDPCSLDKSVPCKDILPAGHNHLSLRPLCSYSGKRQILTSSRTAHICAFPSTSAQHRCRRSLYVTPSPRAMPTHRSPTRQLSRTSTPAAIATTEDILASGAKGLQSKPCSVVRIRNRT